MKKRAFSFISHLICAPASFPELHRITSAVTAKNSSGDHSIPQCQQHSAGMLAPLSQCVLLFPSACWLSIPESWKKQRDLSDREIFTIDGTDLLEGESHSRRVSCGLLKSTEVAERRLRLSLASRICEQCSTMVLCIWSMRSY